MREKGSKLEFVKKSIFPHKFRMYNCLDEFGLPQNKESVTEWSSGLRRGHHKKGPQSLGFVPEFGSVRFLPEGLKRTFGALVSKQAVIRLVFKGYNRLY